MQKALHPRDDKYDIYQEKQEKAGSPGFRIAYIQ